MKVNSDVNIAIDTVYLLPEPSVTTMNWLNSLPVEEKWKWIGEHSIVIKNIGVPVDGR